MPNSLTLELPLPDAGGLLLPNDLPLQGVTVLAVEDSRFASEALRLMCRKLGARLRRADSLMAAASHLKLYRPDVVIVDLGLPDGRGEALIRDLAGRSARMVVIGMSGDAGGRALALAAGAKDYLEKPLETVETLRNLLVRHLPDRAGEGAFTVAGRVIPDALALRDDLAHAAALMESGLEAEGQAYVTGFVRGVARHAHDTDLASATGVDEIRALLTARLAAPDRAFD